MPRFSDRGRNLMKPASVKQGLPQAGLFKWGFAFRNFPLGRPAPGRICGLNLNKGFHLYLRMLVGTGISVGVFQLRRTQIPRWLRLGRTDISRPALHWGVPKSRITVTVRCTTSTEPTWDRAQHEILVIKKPRKEINGRPNPLVGTLLIAYDFDSPHAGAIQVGHSQHLPLD